jgi:endonuclease/exonuclease/phosphatase family metal-dependent hydrolase
LLAITALACTDESDVARLTAPEFSRSASHEPRPNALDVYTQNLFLGGDTGPLFSLDLTNPAAIGDVIQATSAFWAQVQASNISERVAEFVNEIEERRPDVVAFQEAVGYATGYLNPQTGVFTPTAPGPDLLASVLAEISSRGLPYSVAVTQPTSGLALPFAPPTAQGLPALGVQDRVVMLTRDDLQVTTTDRGLYQARIPLGPVQIVRGWVRVTIDREGTPYHFVATHLETQGQNAQDPIRQVHNGQAAELQGAVLAALQGNVVLMGDLNSDAAADPSAPSYTPTYGNLVAGGFTDVWDVAPRRRSDSGVTCCQVDGPAPRTPDERIDFVLFRSDTPARGRGHHRGQFRAEVLGTDQADRTASGLWPSDHGGIAASIALPGNRH